MENDHYNVILSYDPEDLEIYQKVVSALFKKAPLAAQRFEEAKFNGRMIIRRGVDLKTAKGFERLFRDTGATCTFQKTTSMPASTDENPATAECPNCGQPVSQLEECRACGIIIAKAKPRRNPPQEAAPAVQTPPSTQSAMPAILKRAKEYCRPLVKVLQKIQHPIPVEKLSGWGQHVADRLIRCGLVFVIALILEIGLLILCRMMWFLYIATVSGQHYLEAFPDEAAVLQRITGADPLRLALDTTLTVLWVGLLVGVVTQLLHLIRHLYESQHFIGKLLIWFVPYMGATAWVITRRAPFPEMAYAVMLVAVPALCLLTSCLYLAQSILPELGKILKLGTSTVGSISDARGQILQNIREWYDSFFQHR